MDSVAAVDMAVAEDMAHHDALQVQHSTAQRSTRHLHSKTSMTHTAVAADQDRGGSAGLQSSDDTIS